MSDADPLIVGGDEFLQASANIDFIEIVYIMTVKTTFKSKQSLANPIAQALRHDGRRDEQQSAA